MCTYIHTHTHMHTHKHTHTHTHTHTHAHPLTPKHTHTFHKPTPPPLPYLLKPTTIQVKNFIINNNNRIQRRYSRFFTISSQRHELFPTRTLKRPGATVSKSRATHRALITCKCHVTCHLVRRDSSATKFDRVEIAFI